MQWTRRQALRWAAGAVALTAAGCADDDGSGLRAMGSEAPANAPKSQKEYFEQMQAQQEALKAAGKGKAKRRR